MGRLQILWTTVYNTRFLTEMEAKRIATSKATTTGVCVKAEELSEHLIWIKFCKSENLIIKPVN